jgi:hypothetical protein
MATEVSERPVSRDRVIVLKSAEDTAGEFFREVVEGTVRCRVAGKEHVLEPGMVMVIPAGTPHAVWSEDPRGSRSIGEYWPAMNAQAMFRGLIVSEPREYGPGMAGRAGRIAR